MLNFHLPPPPKAMPLQQFQHNISCSFSNNFSKPKNLDKPWHVLRIHRSQKTSLWSTDPIDPHDWLNEKGLKKGCSACGQSSSSIKPATLDDGTGDVCRLRMIDPIFKTGCLARRNHKCPVLCFLRLLPYNPWKYHEYIKINHENYIIYIQYMICKYNEIIKSAGKPWCLLGNGNPQKPAIFNLGRLMPMTSTKELLAPADGKNPIKKVEVGSFSH